MVHASVPDTPFPTAPHGGSGTNVILGDVLREVRPKCHQPRQDAVRVLGASHEGVPKVDDDRSKTVPGQPAGGPAAACSHTIARPHRSARGTDASVGPRPDGVRQAGLHAKLERPRLQSQALVEVRAKLKVVVLPAVTVAA